tara:strand:+ start:310 stop:636 length:327 start_codon:yes stop_codon:yes gene_type:complete
MIACSTCNQNVASTAFDCPHCGAKLRKPKRSFIGKVFKWSFILFNFLMLVWMVSALQTGGEVVTSAADKYEQAGAAIGSAMGVGVILILWAIGDVILGMFVMFTRPSK